MSEDIDPASTDAVLWSLAYRSNPIEDVQLVPYRGGVQGSQYGPEQSDSSMLIDATLKHKMAPLALPTREYMEGARNMGEAWPARAHVILSPGTATISATGPRPGRSSRAAPPPATGNCPASRRSRASAAA